MNQLLKFGLLITTFLVFSCDSSVEPRKLDSAKDYLPLGKGMYQLYDIMEIKYELGIPDTISYELKTLVVDSFASNTGTHNYVIHRSVRSNGQSPWTYKDTWSTSTAELEAVTQEENIAFVKFKLPAVHGTAWNGNAYNDLGEDIYNLENPGDVKTFGGKVYEECFTVNQSNNADFIVFLDQRQEVYAKHVGMVYREIIQLHYCTQAESGCLGEQIVEEGVIYHQTITNHGVE
ncbi:MAG: hypothetical protein WKF87_14935 [Chryseolinea sp.]